MAGTRAKKSGIGAQIEKKMEERYDQEEALGTPGRVVTWLNAHIGSAHDPVPGAAWNEIQNHLKDGVFLCKFINVLLEKEGFPKVPFKAKASQPFVQMGNIENYNKGALVFGVPETSLFQTADLIEAKKGPFINVINGLNQLGFVANDKGIFPQYEAPPAPGTDPDQYGPL